MCISAPNLSGGGGGFHLCLHGGIGSEVGVGQTVVGTKLVAVVVTVWREGGVATLLGAEEGVGVGLCGLTRYTKLIDGAQSECTVNAFSW